METIYNFCILLLFISFATRFNISLAYNNSDSQYCISEFKLDNSYLLIYNNENKEKEIIVIASYNNNNNDTLKMDILIENKNNNSMIYKAFLKYGYSNF